MGGVIVKFMKFITIKMDFKVKLLQIKLYLELPPLRVLMVYTQVSEI